MPKFYLVVVAENILIDRGMSDPLVGFVAQRCVSAKTEKDAIHLIKINVLKDWKINFNRDNKAGTPKLRMAQVSRVKNPFKRFKFADDFLLFRSDEECEEFIEKAAQAFKKWFVIR